MLLSIRHWRVIPWSFVLRASAFPLSRDARFDFLLGLRKLRAAKGMSEGNASEAIAQFEQALRLHPDFAEAEENLRLAKASDPSVLFAIAPVEFWSVRAQCDSRSVLTVAGIGDPGFDGAAGKGHRSSIRQNL
jgi:hypothetical protein